MRTTDSGPLQCLAMILIVIGLSGCATPPAATDREAVLEYEATNDPLEPMNRTVFTFNSVLDKVLFQPLARTYRDVVPAWVQTRIGDALDNLRGPVVFFNDVMQGEPERATTTFMRFWINSTFGLAGLNDIADDMGFPQHDEDFGQSLAVWGSGTGPYLILPLLGPSNPRDTIGLAVDWVVDPFNNWTRNTDRSDLAWARSGTSALHDRAEMLPVTDDLEKTSIDLYAAVRSLYRQRRADQIANGGGSRGNPSASESEFPQMLPLDDQRRAKSP